MAELTAQIVGPAIGELRAPGGSPGRPWRGRVCPVAEALVARIAADIVAPPHEKRSRERGGLVTYTVIGRNGFADAHGQDPVQVDRGGVAPSRWAAGAFTPGLGPGGVVLSAGES
jgi:hypothetical protein